ncbi:5'-nucleotidase C-terminal domain-containing protein [Candidatus Avoscillospira sp. LCP25S3_F1]|uniref:5'-nucleotidase C-terminal domain-containing protein n=1 Tax=Candidatus Avoscillospira sp. LCP25S3_F1 TaxID=3438825 RepID=UPI003F8ED884
MRAKKLVALGLSLATVSAMALPVSAADGQDIVVLYTNDVHCTNDDGMAYAAIAGYKAQMQQQYGDGYVTLVDNGDAIQGGILGSMSQGSWIVEIMNKAGYDMAVPGNHEFDFQMTTFLDIVNNQANYPYLSCNFVDKDGNPVLDSYKMVTYGDVDVAYVGISTPETMTKAAPAYFQNEQGEYIYGFCQGDNGQELYDQVQKTVDEAIAAGADYVVALAHLGEDTESSPWMSTEVIANTSGIDVVLDGHSHSTVPSQTVKNEKGEDVLLSQTGTKAESIGKLTISADGKLSTELVALADVDTTSEAYTQMKTTVESIQKQYQDKANEVVATSKVDLTTLDPATGERAVRSAETNLGDLCADAYRSLLDADVAFVNGGGVRADLAAGDITYGDIIAVHPFGNLACLVEVSGQQILDALEHGSAYAGESENGGFLQVSGLKYTINTGVKSSVVLDEAGNFVKVEGARRVENVQILDKATGEYKAIDPQGTYTLASHNYMLKQGGDGYAMFGKNNVTILKDEVMVDNEVLINYIKNTLGGVVGDEYANPYGQGRITIYAASETPVEEPWYAEAVEYVTTNGIMGETGVDFQPDSAATRGVLIQALYNLSGKPAVEAATFSDVAGTTYADAAAWAEDNGIAGGVGNGLFDGDGVVTRQQLAKIMVSYAAYEQKNTQQTADLSGYTDVAQVAGWAESYMETAVGMGLISGSNNALNPTGTATRAQVAQLLLDYFKMQ